MFKPTSRISAALLTSLMLTLVGFAGTYDPPAAKPARPGDAAKPKRIKPLGAEGYPARIYERLAKRAETLKNLKSHPSGIGRAAIIDTSKKWRIGQTVTVAFKAGTDDAVAKQIADEANEWTKYANLTLDFGDKAGVGFRTWDSSDITFKANIRVSFDQPGLYSHVGTDSVNRVVARPGEESLNLEGYDVNLPNDWQGVVKHEFGHAIGFEHEHQVPGAPCDFRFDDDPGYVRTTDSLGQFIADPAGRRPGLYTSLGGPPNKWSKATVEFNLKELPASNAFFIGPFDKTSIMKYFFIASFFKKGKASPCYTGAENLAISQGDKDGAGVVYPRDPTDAKAASMLRQAMMLDATNAVEIPEAGREQFRQALNRLSVE